MSYDPTADPVVDDIEETEDDDAARELERQAVEQSDNGPKDTDPAEPA